MENRGICGPPPPQHKESECTLPLVTRAIPSQVRGAVKVGDSYPSFIFQPEICKSTRKPVWRDTVIPILNLPDTHN